jgi:hypothetical protein
MVVRWLKAVVRSGGQKWYHVASTIKGAIQFAVTKFLATGSYVPFFAAITLRVQKPL